MKTQFLHIVAVFLLLSVGALCIVDSNFLGEKERLEMEDSVEEIKEGKSAQHTFAGMRGASEQTIFAFVPVLLARMGRSSAFHQPNEGTLEKYLLYCSLKLCS